MSYPTVEQLLYELPPFIDEGQRYFLHLQPWVGRSGWNAFYAVVASYENTTAWVLHPLFVADGVNPVDALINLKGLMRISRFSLVPDKLGFDESKSA